MKVHSPSLARAHTHAQSFLYKIVVTIIIPSVNTNYTLYIYMQTESEPPLSLRKNPKEKKWTTLFGFYLLHQQSSS